MGNIQILMKEERELLNSVRQYGAALVLFNPYTDSWCVLGRNSNIILCSFASHMLTLARGHIHDLDELLS